MDSIRQWAFGVCAAAIACGITQLILPKSSMQRMFTITCSVFFLSCLAAPVMLGPITLDIQDDYQIQMEIQERTQRLHFAVEEDYHQTATESIRKAAAQILEEMGIDYNKIYININTQGQNGISISECEIELNEKYFPQHDQIRQKLMDTLGVNVLIGYVNE